MGKNDSNPRMTINLVQEFRSAWMKIKKELVEYH